MIRGEAAGPVGPLDVTQARAEVEAAHSEVARLCDGGQWTMRIPAQEQQDSDLVIDRGLRVGEAALAEVERLRGLVGEALDLALRHFRHEPAPSPDLDHEAMAELLRIRREAGLT